MISLLNHFGTRSMPYVKNIEIISRLIQACKKDLKLAFFVCNSRSRICGAGGGAGCLSLRFACFFRTGSPSQDIGAQTKWPLVPLEQTAECQRIDGAQSVGFCH